MCSRLRLIWDTLIWWFFLVLLASASFLQGRISSELWLYFSGIVYCLLAAHLLSACFGGRCNFSAIRASLPAIGLLLCCVTLLWLQTVLPYQSYLHEALYSSEYHREFKSAWFAPNNVWSVVPGKTQWLLISELLMLAVFILTLGVVSSRRRVVQLLCVFVFVGVLHGLIAVLSKYANVQLVDVKQLDGHFNVARAWFVNRNHFASFIVLTLFGALSLQSHYFFKYQQRHLVKLLVDQLITAKAVVLVTIFVAMIALFLSQSRAGLLGPLLATILCAAILGKHMQRFGQRRRLVFVALAISGIALVYFGSEFIERLNSDALSLGERTAQWSLTWEAICKEWLLGYGGNSYATVFQVFRDTGDFRQVVFNQAHNDYLHIWLEQGLVGLGLWLALMLFVLRRAFRTFSQSASTLVAGAALAGAIVILATLLQSLVDFNLHIINIRVYFFVIMACMFVLPSIHHCKTRL